MRKPTVAELRDKSAEDLAKRKDNATKEEAKSLMNAYYRLVGICDTLLVMENDERTCNSFRVKMKEEERDRREDRLNKRFAEYNAELVYFGWFPTICELGTTRDLYLAHFYN